MSEKKIFLTYEKIKELEDELQDLKVNRRKEVAEKIKEARGQGDLSENAEYDAAKEEQGEIEARIIKLEKMFKNVERIDEDNINTEVISLGCKVKLLDIEFDEEVTYFIVGFTEADPVNGKISNESPVGSALIGHKKGDVVEVFVQANTQPIKYKVLDIFY